AKGAVRLTEFEPERRDGFVNRLNQETISYYFTNLPDDFKVVDLWAVFAKFGRVGEVYIPQERDKRGNRFGFVKFKEVKGVEALSKRLEDVWLGTYKIRTNLSRFGRINSKGEPVDKGSSSIDVVDADVALDFFANEAIFDRDAVGEGGDDGKGLSTDFPLYGVPLHAWGESTFRAVASRCGVFVDVDDVTRNRLRLDVARMKIETSICSCVDFSIKLVVQGASYMRSEAASSCASGGQAVARVVLEGLDEGDTDNEASIACQCDVPFGVQEVRESTAVKQDMGICGKKTVVDACDATVIPSIDAELIVTEETNVLGTPSHVRGSTS
ncbi:endonuclease/exonuclease/phosphatase family protein, partial [Trifolium medium]|nr:endonuclease/exonuclease/phosphatase family protein [Trifolium medium]